jgi:hypothetical protein
MRINIKAQVKITPNKRTKQIWDEHYAKYKMENIPIPEKLPLWEWAQVFGDRLGMGFLVPHDPWMELIEDDCIEKGGQ